jgi:hypothetical protein
MMSKGSSPRVAIHVIPVARRSWKVMAFRVSSLIKSSARVMPALAMQCFNLLESTPALGMSKTFLPPPFFNAF